MCNIELPICQATVGFYLSHHSGSHMRLVPVLSHYYESTEL